MRSQGPGPPERPPPPTLWAGRERRAIRTKTRQRSHRSPPPRNRLCAAGTNSSGAFPGASPAPRATAPQPVTGAQTREPPNLPPGAGRRKSRPDAMRALGIDPPRSRRRLKQSVPGNVVLTAAKSQGTGAPRLNLQGKVAPRGKCACPPRAGEGMCPFLRGRTQHLIKGVLSATDHLSFKRNYFRL